MTFRRPKTRRVAMRSAAVLAGAVPAVLVLMATGVRAQAPQNVPTTNFTLDFTVAEIMDAMVMSTAQVLWDAVSVDVTEKGTIEKIPKTDEDWQKVRWAAVTLAEATNVLSIPGRKIAPPGTKSENPDAELTPEQIQKLYDSEFPAFVAHAKVLNAAAMEAVKAIDARNVDGLSEAGGTIDAACESCHLQFWYPNQ
jgi:cytochrome c556